ncbi:4-(cytidine 5'-diphospho)-2-C-methyl-D-erythritol kinase [bacterium]|nr:4-(cytidine 5'-diphospho)-2-C-methyl-D-erythritol kinase [bacterium]MDC0459492.1 4-(cytidine 5'-diphospho)-2-C-methyl-D-erythritol kinase [Crocinitomicaceae bacterium]
MIKFAPAKINLGLHVLGKRSDGFHRIETCMMEIPFYDIIEITKSFEYEFIQSGIDVGGKSSDNLCTKAFLLLKRHHEISNVRIHLRKQVPIGAGLGGGSSDAVTVIKMLVELFQLQVSEKELEEMSSSLGSDCPFFIKGGIQLAEGRGEVLSSITVKSIPRYLVLLNPGIHISTKEAYSNVSSSQDKSSLEEVFSSPNRQWKKHLKNDFEESVFKNHPKIKELKTKLYEAGAYYASMSGSGSSVFGLFNEPVTLSEELKKDLVYSGNL